MATVAAYPNHNDDDIIYFSCNLVHDSERLIVICFIYIEASIFLWKGTNVSQLKLKLADKKIMVGTHCGRVGRVTLKASRFCL